MRAAARACEEAIALDPGYALAHAVLAHARSLTAPRMEVLPESRDVTAPIQRALELAPDDPGVQHAYAAVLGNMGRTADAMTVSMEIDVLLEGLKEGPIVVDAEYKTEVASASLQQVVTYCFAVGSREAVLAFPAGHLDALGSYSFAGSGLDRHGIPASISVRTVELRTDAQSVSQWRENAASFVRDVLGA